MNFKQFINNKNDINDIFKKSEFNRNIPGMYKKALPKNTFIEEKKVDIEKKENNIIDDDEADDLIYSYLYEIFDTPIEVIEKYERIYNRDMILDYRLGQIKFNWLDELNYEYYQEIEEDIE